jgi:hypothetical protein
MLDMLVHLRFKNISVHVYALLYVGNVLFTVKYNSIIMSEFTWFETFILIYIDIVYILNIYRTCVGWR